jgi:hypothetical protein
MNYLRWLLKQIDFDTPFTPIAIIISFFLLFVSSQINFILCIIVAILMACFYGTIGYIVISDAFRRSYARYLKEKNKP